MKKTVILFLLLMLISAAIYASNTETKNLELKSQFEIDNYIFKKYVSDDGQVVFLYKNKDYDSTDILAIYDNDGKLLYRDWEW